MIIVSISFSCREGNKYESLTSDEKAAYLFYSNENDNIEYIINNTDTILFTVTEKNIGFVGYPNNYTLKQYCFVSLLNNKDCNYNMYSNYIANGFDDPTDEYPYGNLDSCFGCCNTTIGVFTGKVSISEITKKDLTISINNNTYHNVFLLTNSNNYTKAYTNKEYGILKIWNDTLCYEILNR